jgi:hypothetical protein
LGPTLSIFGLLFGPKLLLNDRTFFTRLANWLPTFDGILFLQPWGQLLNLVQSQKFSHTFSWAPPPFQEIFFSPEDLACSPNYPVEKNIPTDPALLLLLPIFFFSKLSFILLSLSMLQLCNHPLSLLMFKEKLGIATTSRCEQHEGQYFQEETKQVCLQQFFCTCGFSIFSI